MACPPSLVRALDVSVEHLASTIAPPCWDMLEVPLGWTSGAIVRDYDTISKI